jgi:hypothetical protein
MLYVLRCWVLAHNLSYFLLVGCAILFVEVICISLRWRIWVRVVEKVLDSEEDFFDGDCGSPGLLLIENRQANGARGIDIWVEKWRYEFACTNT